MFCADDDEESKEAISTEESSDLLSVAMVKRLMDINESMREEMKEMKKSIEENNKRTKKIEESMEENNKRTKKMEEEMNKKMNKMILKDEAKGMINKAQ